jgi:hypothetical protein
LAIEALLAIDGIVLQFLSMIVGPAPTLTFLRTADLLIGMVPRTLEFLVAIRADLYGHSSSELTLTAGVAWSPVHTEIHSGRPSSQRPHEAGNLSEKFDSF